MGRPKVGDIWFRFDDVVYAAPLDEYEMPVGSSRVAVELRRYVVAKITPKGVRLDNGRLVLEDAGKKFACPTVDAARKSFLARKKRQLAILTARVRHVERAIVLATGEQKFA